jgi:hypothetical protein
VTGATLIISMRRAPGKTAAIPFVFLTALDVPFQTVELYIEGVSPKLF